MGQGRFADRPYCWMLRPLSPHLSYDKHGKVAWLRLCRPEQGNRLTPSMAEQLAALCTVIEEDDEVEIVVLTGAGSVFCLGLECTTDRGNAVTAGEIRAQFGELRCVGAVAALTKPTLAALNGDAVGVGLELALACDLRITVADGHCALTQVSEGVIPFCGGTQRLPRIVGQAKALELILTSESINATEAQRIGLVSAVVPSDSFANHIDDVIAILLGKSPIALRLGKEAVHKAMDLTLDQGLRLEEDLYVLLQTTEDRAEGIRAFLSKRQPIFTGH